MFAPEVKALLTANVGGSIDYSSISELFHFNHLFGNKTLFENIKEVPEASYITYQKGKLGISIGIFLNTRRHMRKRNSQKMKYRATWKKCKMFLAGQ